MFTLSAAQIRIAKVASTDSRRPSLSTVHITADTLEATDGHIMLQSWGDYPPELHGLWDAKQFAKIKRPEQGVTRQNGELRDSTTTVIPKIEDQHYPNTDKVWPGERDEYAFALGADVLRTLAKALPKGDVPVRFYVEAVQHPVSPLRIEYDDGTCIIRGLVMPHRWDK